MTLIDTNILMYAGGAVHPHREPSIRLLDAVIRGSVPAALDAEALQEILHRFRSIHRWADGEAIYVRARILFPSVLPVTVEVMDDARLLMGRYSQLGARDAIHAAVARVNRIESICSFDRVFDQVDGVVRVEPDQVQRSGSRLV